MQSISQSGGARTNRFGWRFVFHSVCYTADLNSITRKRVNVLGVGISVLNLHTALDAIVNAVRERRKGYICVTGVHGVMEAQEDAVFRQILNGAFLCTPDGMPMVWMGKLNGHREMRRVYGPDLMLDVCAWSETNPCRHFFYGGAPGVAEQLRDQLTAHFPKLQIAGCFTPPFRAFNSEEEKRLQEIIRAVQPDIMWVGLGCPKQEKFMAEFLPKLDVTLMIGVGAAFDFHSGRVKQAPSWMQRSGLEWFYRLCQEPRRLAKRYFRNNPLFVLKIAGQLCGLRKYSLE
jgi:N-acetylglucosaminyldiphosphoundecaprenol N-acetyl-beta-D-mannosaminyltransferase